jgi:hypothetical protein
MSAAKYGAFGGEEGAVREPREAESIRQFKANAARLMRWRANTMKLSWVLPALVLVVYGSGVGQSGLIAQAEPATKLEQATDSKIERVAARASVDAARVPSAAEAVAAAAADAAEGDVDPTWLEAAPAASESR